jgi:hypothetical protein
MTTPDPELGRRLRNALGHARAPESWIRDALEVPVRRPLPALRPAPLLVVLLPHLAGLALLLGFAGSLVLRPDLLEALGRAWESILPGGAIGSFTARALETGAVTCLGLYVLSQGARGFPALRRRLPRR